MPRFHSNHRGWRHGGKQKSNIILGLAPNNLEKLGIDFWKEWSINYWPHNQWSNSSSATKAKSWIPTSDPWRSYRSNQVDSKPWAIPGPPAFSSFSTYSSDLLVPCCDGSWTPLVRKVGKSWNRIVWPSKLIWEWLGRGVKPWTIRSNRTWLGCVEYVRNLCFLLWQGFHKYHQNGVPESFRQSRYVWPLMTCYRMA